MERAQDCDADAARLSSGGIRLRAKGKWALLSLGLGLRLWTDVALHIRRPHEFWRPGEESHYGCQYPLGDSIELQITASRPTPSAIRLRIPAWAETPLIRVNGKRVPETVQSGTFASLSREWNSGDRIELKLPRRLELKPVDAEHPNMVALVSGRIVLFAISDDTRLTWKGGARNTHCCIA